MQNFGFCRLCLPIIPACVCFHKMAYISKYPPIKLQKTRLIMGWGGVELFCFLLYPRLRSSSFLNSLFLPSHHRCVIVIYTLSYEPLFRWLYFSLFTPFSWVFFKTRRLVLFICLPLLFSSMCQSVAFWKSIYRSLVEDDVD